MATATAQAPQVTWDDEEKQQPAAATPQVQWDEPEAAPKPAPTTPAFQAPKTIGEAAWSAVKHANPMAAASDLSTGIGKVGDWLHGKSEEAQQQNLSNVAAGRPSEITPTSVLDLGARTAKALSGATSPTSIATGAAAIAAPEIVAPALIAHGGLNTIEGLWNAKQHGLSPEAAEQTLSGAGEAVGGAALGAHRIQTGPGPLSKAISERSPVERGTQAYQKIIAPTASKSRVQLDEAETIRRASPYLSEQAKLTPVKTGPGAGPKGQDLGVQNYRQNADIAAARLWDEKIAPLQDQYGAAPIDTVKVADEIRATHNPNGPPNPGKAKAVSEMADHYGQPTTIKDAVEKVKALNEDKQVVAFEKAPPGSERAQLILADPAIEAKVQAANSLRDAIFDSIEQHGSKVDADYVRSARKDFGALKQVSENLNNASVPTPGGFVDKLMNTAGAVLRPRSGPAVANRFFNNPNKLAAKSSRLFGAANLTPEPAPPLRTTPWAPAAPAPFIAPPAPPQAPPNAAGQVTGIGSVVNPQAVGPRGTAGTRFAPKGLLPGPIAGTPATQVGTPPPVGFPARIGTWEGFPNPNRAGPGFEPVPTTPVTQAPPGVFRAGSPLERPAGPANKPLEFKRTDKAPEPTVVKKMTAPADRYEAILKDPNATEEQKVEAQKKIDALKPKK